MLKMSKHPPNDRGRVDLFLASVEAYSSFHNQFALPDEIRLGTQETDQGYWLRIIHGAFLRKYIAPNDEMFMTKVVRSMTACVDRTDPEVAAVWVALGRAAKKLPTQSTIEYNLNGVDVPTSDLALDELYGLILHGDWDRWQRSKQASGMADFALFTWMGEIAQMVGRVRDYWRLAERDGLVVA
jgi:hypothetical protein